jgi:hypothetical protein
MEHLTENIASASRMQTVEETLDRRARVASAARVASFKRAYRH